MNAKLVWFLLGALFASVFWAIAAIGLNERLMQVFYGFAGHLVPKIALPPLRCTMFRGSLAVKSARRLRRHRCN